MKIFSLVIRDIWSFMKSKKLLFTLLLLGFTAALYVALYTITSGMDELIQGRDEFADKRIIIENIDDLSEGQAMLALNEILNRWGWDKYTIFFHLSYDETIDDGVMVVACNEIPADLIHEDYLGFKEGEFLSDEDIVNNLPVCVVSHTLLDYSENATWLGEKLHVDGIKLDVKGVHMYDMYLPILIGGGFSIDQIVVPGGLLKQTQLPISSIQITGNSKPTPEQIETMQSWKDIYASSALVRWSASHIEKETWRHFIQKVISLVILGGVALVNMVSILINWIYDNRRQWYAFYIIGASKKKLLILVFLEMVVFGLLAFIFAGIGYLASEPLFNWGRISYRLQLPQGIIVYIGIMLVGAGIVMARSIPIIHRIVEEGGK